MTAPAQQQPSAERLALNLLDAERELVRAQKELTAARETEKAATVRWQDADRAVDLARSLLRDAVREGR